MESCLIRIAFSIIVLFQQHILTDACGNGFIRYDDSCYRLSRDVESWAVAMYTCKLENGNLAQINSARENEFLHQLITSHSVKYAWIAATDIDNEGDWLWWPDKSRMSYSNWSSGQPDNYNGAENCGALLDTGKWGDGPCHTFSLYICEMPYESVQPVG